MRHEALHASPFCHRLQGKMADLVFEGFPTMAKKPVEQIAEATTEAVTKSGEAAEKITKGNAAALTESGNASRAADPGVDKGVPGIGDQERQET